MNLAYGVRFCLGAVVILSGYRGLVHRKNHRTWSLIATREKNRKRITRVHVFGNRIKSPRKKSPRKKSSRKKNPPEKIPLNAVEREPVQTRVLNPNASEASDKPKRRSYRKTKLNFLIYLFWGILSGNPCFPLKNNDNFSIQY